jgi:molybdenum cofactor cytidylyltransferase
MIEPISCLLLAAGASKRMGANKLSLPVGSGLSMLEATAKALSRVALSNRVLVVRDASSLLFDPEFYSFQVVEIGDEADLGMHRSLKLGLTSLEGGDAATMVCLGDQPFLRTEDYTLLLETYRAGLRRELDLLSPIRGARRGNPAVIHRRYFAEVMNEPDRDQGCRYLFERYPSRVNAWEATIPAFFQDLDTPEEYKACLN